MPIVVLHWFRRRKGKQAFDVWRIQWVILSLYLVSVRVNTLLTKFDNAKAAKFCQAVATSWQYRCYVCSHSTLAQFWCHCSWCLTDHTLSSYDHTGVELNSIVPQARLTVVVLSFDPPRCYRVRVGDHLTLPPYSLVGNNRVGKDPFHLPGSFPSSFMKPWGRGGSVRSRCLASWVQSLKLTTSMHLALSRSSVHTSTRCHCCYCWLHTGQDRRM